MSPLRSLLWIGASGTVYAMFLRPRLLRFGATRADAARSLPGDDLIVNPTFVTNRAISIDAPVALVWPWIAQMGELPRGGFYSYEFVERAMGMKIKNATVLLPDFQEPRAGDVIDSRGTMTVRAVVGGEALVLGPPPGLWLDSTWALAVYPETGGGTRFISRLRARVVRWSPLTPLILLVLDPGQLLMERKMLVEIKQRAEQLVQSERSPDDASSIT